MIFLSPGLRPSSTNPNPCHLNLQPSSIHNPPLNMYSMEPLPESISSGMLPFLALFWHPRTFFLISPCMNTFPMLDDEASARESVSYASTTCWNGATPFLVLPGEIIEEILLCLRAVSPTDFEMPDPELMGGEVEGATTEDITLAPDLFFPMLANETTVGEAEDGLEDEETVGGGDEMVVGVVDMAGEDLDASEAGGEETMDVDVEIVNQPGEKNGQNDSHPAPADTLADREDGRVRRRVERLGWMNAIHVCRRLRGIALSYSNLWTLIDVGQISHQTQYTPMKWIPEFISRSASSPLDVSIRISPKYKDKTLEALNFCLSPPHVSRIRCLRLDDGANPELFHPIIELFVSVLANMSSLRYLDFYWIDALREASPLSLDARPLNWLTIRGALTLPPNFTLYTNLTCLELIINRPLPTDTIGILNSILFNTPRLQYLIFTEERNYGDILIGFELLVIPPTVARFDLRSCHSLSNSLVYNTVVPPHTAVHLYHTPGALMDLDPICKAFNCVLQPSSPRRLLLHHRGLAFESRPQDGKPLSRRFFGLETRAKWYTGAAPLDAYRFVDFSQISELYISESVHAESPQVAVQTSAPTAEQWCAIFGRAFDVRHVVVSEAWGDEFVRSLGGFTMVPSGTSGAGSMKQLFFPVLERITFARPLAAKKKTDPHRKKLEIALNSRKQSGRPVEVEYDLNRTVDQLWRDRNGDMPYEDMDAFP
ncbi:hypothetical protein OF83DRAFT_1152248 [Amylostereum chailletii]|nr:hypothetical protein OF83DRAFT_1152248 [Amylostereum chailletii]